MLQDSLFESQGRQKTRKPLTVVISAAVHVVTIVILAAIPLVQTQAITIPAVDLSLWAPRPPEPLKIRESVAVQPVKQTYTRPDPKDLIAPEAIPREIAVFDTPANPPAGFPSTAGGGIVSSVLSALVDGERDVAQPAPPSAPLSPPPPLPPAVNTRPVRVGGAVQQGSLIHRVNPIYPPLARQARVQGVVVLEAIITREGTIHSLRVVTGHPILAQAAADAVQQWRYRPTLLNSDPVEVITTITVTFTFQ
jgi:protein TonB